MLTFRELRMSKNSAEYEAVQELYESMYMESKILRLKECRTDAWFYRHKVSNQVRVFSNSCHVKFCPLCSASKAIQIRKDTELWLKTAEFPKMLTLTLKHDSESQLASLLEELYSCFRQLRRLALWKRIKGGAWFFEVKETSKGWHAHLHVLCSGGYLPQSVIRRDWKRLTNGSSIIDIRRVRNTEKAAQYVSKYATKPMLLHKLSLTKRQELYLALHGRRMYGCFGNFHRTPKEPISNWQALGSWSFVSNLRNSDNRAEAIFQAWLSHSEYIGDDLNDLEAFRHEIPPPIKQQYEIEPYLF